MNMRNLAIMIADADRDASALLADQIMESYPDAMISMTETGKDLLEALCYSKFDIVFLDMILPYTEISKLQEAIRTLSKGKKTKLILLTETLRPHWMTIAITLSAHEVLLKPYKPIVLSRLIETCVQAGIEHSMLLIDGSTRLRRLLRSALEASEFHIAVTDADSGRRALQYALNRKFTMAFINKSLSDTPATEIGCQLMTLSSDETAVVIMDSKQNPSRNSNSILGVKETLRVPFDVNELNRAIYGALGLWRPYLMNSLIKENELKRLATDAA